ncbi:MAG: hypothetical protein WD080_12125 [Egibacteraceae bacterium]
MTPTCAYPVDAALLELLDAHLGPPLDSYVRGWQVWLEPNGPGEQTLEWRLHPPAGFVMPRGVNPHDLFDVVLQGIAEPGDDFPAGQERRRLDQVWEALEVFPAFPEPTLPTITPPSLVEAATAALGGRRPDVAGHVDHARLGDRWKGRRGDLSVGRVLFDTLDPVPPP